MTAPAPNAVLYVVDEDTIERIRRVESLVSQIAEAQQKASSNSDDRLSVSETAALCRVSVGCIRKWIREGRGPRFERVGARSIRFRRADVENYLGARAEGNGASPTVGGNTRAQGRAAALDVTQPRNRGSR